MKTEKYWVSNTERKGRKRVHVDRKNGITMCGYNVKDANLTPISKIEMRKNTIPMCSNCIQHLSVKRNSVDMGQYPSTNQEKIMKAKGIKIPKKHKDEIANPQLKKFKSIIRNAKEKKVVIENAITEVVNYEEDQMTPIETLKSMIPKLEATLLEATSEAHENWEVDTNKFNDTKHFHVITALRNFSQAIQATKDL